MQLRRRRRAFESVAQGIVEREAASVDCCEQRRAWSLDRFVARALRPLGLGLRAIRLALRRLGVALRLHQHHREPLDA